MRRFLAACLELLAVWLFPGNGEEYERMPGLYCVLWCEGYDASKPVGRRVQGRREELAWTDSLVQAVTHMQRSGAAVVRARGGECFVMAPEGFPVRRLETVAPAERASAFLNRMTARSGN